MDSPGLGRISAKKRQRSEKERIKIENLSLEDLEGIPFRFCVLHQINGKNELQLLFSCYGDFPALVDRVEGGELAGYFMGGSSHFQGTLV